MGARAFLGTATSLLLLGAGLACAAARAGEARTLHQAPDLVVRVFPVNVETPARPFYENLYLAYDPSTGSALIVDPGTRSGALERFVEQHHLRVSAILNTHGHRDHIGADGYYAGRYRVPLLAHAADAPFFEKKPFQVAFFDQEGPLPGDPGGLGARAFHTPGHSPGSVAYLVRGVLFSGDTLFAGGIGRTWADSAEERWKLKEQEMAGIREKLFPLPDATPVYPGHDEETTVGAEKASNPYFQPPEP